MSPLTGLEEWGKALADVQACIRGESAPSNEHQTRISVIDPLLDALGWSLANRRPHREEFAIQGDNGMKFLDYLCVDDSTGLPKLIVEAKQWSDRSPRPAPGRAELQQLDCAALIMMGVGALLTDVPKESWPLTQEWMAWLEQVGSYTRYAKNELGAAPTRVVVTNGRWLLVVTDPVAVFLKRGRVPEGSIRFYEGDALSRYDEIVGLISFESLCAKWRALIAPEELPAYLDGGKVRSCFRGVATSHVRDTDPFKVRPTLKIWPALLVCREDGAILSVVSSEIAVALRPHPGDTAPDVAGHVIEMETAHLRLDQEIAQHVQSLLAPKPLKEFPGFVPRGAQVVEDLAYGKKAYATWTTVDSGVIHVIALGDAQHFIVEDAGYNTCQFHSDDSSRAASKLFAGTRTSRDDHTMFVSGDHYYCGHRDIRAVRSPVCIIRDIELQLCCRSCTFLSECWNGKQAAMPCHIN